MDCSQLGSSVYGILQARILKWVALPSCRGTSRPRHWQLGSLPRTPPGKPLPMALDQNPHTRKWPKQKPGTQKDFEVLKLKKSYTLLWWTKMGWLLVMKHSYFSQTWPNKGSQRMVCPQRSPQLQTVYWHPWRLVTITTFIMKSSQADLTWPRFRST